MHIHHCRIDDELHDRGLSKTTPRHQIIELFEENRPWSAQTIGIKIHSIARTTIYRTLRILEKKGYIVPIASHGDRAVYERAGQPHHDHARCTSCDLVACLPCPIPELSTPHVLEVQKVCSSCK